MQAHIAAALTPPVLVGIASIVVAITLALVGWIVLHRSAEARELRKEQRARQHAHEIARKRLRGRLDSHIEQISNHLHGNDILALDVWQRNHDHVMACAAEPNVIDLLGNRYDDFKRVLNREQMEIDRIAQLGRAGEEHSPAQIASRDRALRTAVADVIDLYAPYLTFVEGSRMAHLIPQLLERARRY